MPENRPNRLLILALFFLSGISGLVYQIVWTRMLVLVFGNTLLATSTVLTAFMAGLAAGSYLLGEYIDRKPRRLIRLYAALEVGIGLFGLLFPVLLGAFAPLYTGLYQALNENLVAMNLVRFVICSAMIFLPTFFMGGTLPVLLKYFSRDLEKIGYDVGFLYGLNTAGAVAGCVAAGYWLLGGLGMQRTTWVAVAINLAVGLVAWLLPDSRATPETPGAETRDRTSAEQSHGRLYDRPVTTAVLIGIGLSGFCALAYEVLWARMLNLFLNNNIYSFTATIATFLLGIAIGSLLYASFLSRLRARIALFAAIEIAIGLLAIATPYLFTSLQGALFSKQGEALTIVKTAAVMIVPTILMGIAVPLAIQICQWGAGREGRSVGAVYAFNTVGSIFGAFVAGFVLIPTLGLHLGLIAVAALNFGAGFLPLAAGARGARRLGLATAWAASVAVFAISAPQHLFRDLYLQANPDSEILSYHEGKIANVVVYDFEAGYKDLHLNGIEEASSRLWHVQLFKLLGVLPMLSHEDPDEALMIAFGAGMSAGAAIEHASSLEVVDLNPDIGGPAEAFTRENLDVINNPKLTVTVNDGRNALLLSPKRYSVIISDATNPKMFDSWTLYTREFYELTKSRLLPGGVFSQWLVYPLPGDSIKVILNTFRSVYPHMSLWCIHGSSQCLMLGTPERLDIDYQQFSERLEPVLESSRLVEYGVTTTTKFLSFLLLGEDEIGELLEGFTKISTDDLPLPQFRLGRELEGVQDAMNLLRYQRTILPYLTNLGDDADRIAAELEAHRDISLRLNMGFFTNRRLEHLKARYLAARHGMPDDANVASALRYDSERERHFLERLERRPDDANVHNSLGYVYWQQGDLEQATEHLETALELAPGFANALANLAQVLVARGDLDEATRRLLELEQLNPTSQTIRLVESQLKLVHVLRRLRYEAPSFALYQELASARMGVGDLMGAVEAAQLALSLAAGNANLAAAIGDFFTDMELVDEAHEAYLRAFEASPGDPPLAAKVSRLGELRHDDLERQRWLHERHVVEAVHDADTGHPRTCRQAMRVWGSYDFRGHVRRENLARAAALFAESFEAKPDELHAYLDAALLHEILGEYREAVSVLDRAEEAELGSPVIAATRRRLEALDALENGDAGPDRRAELWLEIGELEWRTHRLEPALVAFEEALSAVPGHPRALEMLALVQIDTGRLPEAEETLLRALNGATTDVRARMLAARLEQVRAALAAGPAAASSPPSPSSP